MTITALEAGTALGEASGVTVGTFVFELYDHKGECALRNGTNRVVDLDGDSDSVTFELKVPKDYGCIEIVVWSALEVLVAYSGASSKLCDGYPPSVNGKRVNAVFKNHADTRIEWVLGGDQPDCALKITIKHDP